MLDSKVIYVANGNGDRHPCGRRFYVMCPRAPGVGSGSRVVLLPQRDNLDLQPADWPGK